MSDALIEKAIGDAIKDIKKKDDSSTKFVQIFKNTSLYKLLVASTTKLVESNSGTIKTGSGEKDVIKVSNLAIAGELRTQEKMIVKTKDGTYYIGPRPEKAKGFTKKNNSKGNQTQKVNRSNPSPSSLSEAQQSAAVTEARRGPLSNYAKRVVNQRTVNEAKEQKEKNEAREVKKIESEAKDKDWKARKPEREAKKAAEEKAKANTRQNALNAARKVREANAAANLKAKQEAAAKEATEFFSKKGIDLTLPTVINEIDRAYKFGAFTAPDEADLAKMTRTNEQKNTRKLQLLKNSIDNEIFVKIAASRNEYIEIPNGPLKTALLANNSKVYSNNDVPVGNAKGKKITLQSYSDKLKARNIIKIFNPDESKIKIFIGPKTVPVQPTPSTTVPAPVPSLISTAESLPNESSKSISSSESVVPDSVQQLAANNTNLGPAPVPSLISTAESLPNESSKSISSSESVVPDSVQQLAANNTNLDPDQQQLAANTLKLGPITPVIKWTKVKNSTSGQDYYVSKNTGESTWTMPTTNWSNATNNATNRMYYINNKTGESTWNDPTVSLNNLNLVSTVVSPVSLVPTNVPPTNQLPIREGPSIPTTVRELRPIKGVKPADFKLMSYSILLAYQSSDRFIRIDDPSFVQLIAYSLQDPSTQTQSGFIMQGKTAQIPAVDKLIFNAATNASKKSEAAKASALLINILGKIQRIIIKDKVNNFFMGPNDINYFRKEEDPKNIKVLTQNNADKIITSLPNDKKRLVNSNNNLIGNLKAAMQQTIRMVYNSNGEIESITPIKEAFDYSGMEKIKNSKDPNIIIMYRDSEGKIYTEFALPELELANSVAIGGTRKQNKKHKTKQTKRKSFPPVKTRRRR